MESLYDMNIRLLKMMKESDDLHNNIMALRKKTNVLTGLEEKKCHKCWLCDSDKVGIVNHPGSWGAQNIWVECQMCGCRTGSYDDITKAVSKWNRKGMQEAGDER